MARPLPTNIIIEMSKRGFSNFDIIRYLKSKGYKPLEISDGFNQAKIKMELSGEGNDEDIIEKDLIEKNEERKEKNENIDVFDKPSLFQIQLLKDISLKLKNIEDKIKKQEEEIEKLKEEISLKIQDGSLKMKKIDAELKALQQTFSKILEPLAHNVKIVSGMLNLPEEEKKAREVEKEIKKEEEELKNNLEKKESKKKKNEISLEDIF